MTNESIKASNRFLIIEHDDQTLQTCGNVQHASRAQPRTFQTSRSESRCESGCNSKSFPEEIH